MNHLQAIDLLPRRNELDPERRRRLEAHAAGCEECRGWLATWDLLSAAAGAGETCLDSDELCAFALAAADLDEAARERCRRHLETCADCAREVGEVRAAVDESADAPRPAITPPASGPWVAPGRAWLALAATLVLMAGGLLLADRVLVGSARDYRLSGESVAGSRSIATERSILVEATELESGSALELESVSVALGNGFSIRSGATLRVGVSGGPPG